MVIAEAHEIAANASMVIEIQKITCAFDLICTLELICVLDFSMPEMPHAGKDHCHSIFVSRLDHFGIADGTAWMYRCCGPCFVGFLQAVFEGEEGISCCNCAIGIQAMLLGLFSPEASGIYSAYLTRSYADGAI